MIAVELKKLSLPHEDINFKRMNQQLDVKRRPQLSEIWLIFVTYLGKIKDQHNRSVRFEKR